MRKAETKTDETEKYLQTRTKWDRGKLRHGSLRHGQAETRTDKEMDRLRQGQAETGTD
jgi:hypothetical protein